MKKVLALVMVLILTALCFAGCSGKKEDTTNQSVNTKKLVILDEPLTTEPYGFAAKKGNNALIQAVNKELTAMLADGTIKSIFEKYNAPYTAPEASQTTSEQIEATDDSLQKVLDAGKLVIATSPDFPPFENLEDDGSIVGIEIDILNLICEKLGVKLEIQQMDFDSILPGLTAGKYDLGVSGFTATEERKTKSLFTDPYCLAAISIVVPEGSAVKTKADLAGKAISCQSGTTAENYCMANGLDYKSFAANNDAQMALTTGKVEAWAIDDLTASEMVAEYNKGA